MTNSVNLVMHFSSFSCFVKLKNTKHLGLTKLHINSYRQYANTLKSIVLLYKKKNIVIIYTIMVQNGSQSDAIFFGICSRFLFRSFRAKVHVYSWTKSCRPSRNRVYYYDATQKHRPEGVFSKISSSIYSEIFETGSIRSAVATQL